MPDKETYIKIIKLQTEKINSMNRNKTNEFDILLKKLEDEKSELEKIKKEKDEIQKDNKNLIEKTDESFNEEIKRLLEGVKDE